MLFFIISAPMHNEPLGFIIKNLLEVGKLGPDLQDFIHLLVGVDHNNFRVGVFQNVRTCVGRIGDINSYIDTISENCCVVTDQPDRVIKSYSLPKKKYPSTATADLSLIPLVINADASSLTILYSSRNVENIHLP